MTAAGGRSDLRQLPRKLVLILSIPLPGPLKRFVYRTLLGWQIGQRVRLGLSYIDAQQVEIADGAIIGHFNVFRNLAVLRMAAKASIGQWNWITCAEMFTPLPATRDGNVPSGLLLGRESALTSRHYVDCAGGVAIGDFTTVAGVRSTLLTHQIDTVSSRQTVKPIRIGSYCFIGSDVRLTPGSEVPDRCVIAMGAVVASRLQEPGLLYAGVPARAVKDVEGAYFERTDGRVTID